MRYTSTDVLVGQAIEELSRDLLLRVETESWSGWVDSKVVKNG